MMSLPSRRGAARGMEPAVWLAGAAVASLILMLLGTLAAVLKEGLAVFWPGHVAQVRLADGRWFLGEPAGGQVDPATGVRSTLWKTGNREWDPQRQDFRWLAEDELAEVAWPADAVLLERRENGNFYGFLRRVEGPRLEAADASAAADLWTHFRQAVAVVRQAEAAEILPLARQVAQATQRLRALKRQLRKAEYRLRRSAADRGREGPARPGQEEVERLKAQSEQVAHEAQELMNQQNARTAELRHNVAVFERGPGEVCRIPLADIVRACRPNRMGLAEKVAWYAGHVKDLLVQWPRESNTEGGLFPAIFGTVLLVFLMSVLCFPVGVLAGIYLGEYARQGLLVRVVRVAVNNLAGIPSIVYGMFGLGFFVYTVGKTVDRLAFPEWAEVGQPVFGTGGVLWAALTLGLLTAPVVIVATEEALRALPRAVREGSYALGATQWQTLTRVLLPMASPGIMTGFILAMARAAGEVAPLMLTGAVKLVSDLAIDSDFPYVHLDRKFMHLGFHIYDLGFQSPNVDASRPMAYLTTLVLVAVVIALTGTALLLRNRMRRYYQPRSL